MKQEDSGPSTGSSLSSIRDEGNNNIRYWKSLSKQSHSVKFNDALLLMFIAVIFVFVTGFFIYDILTTIRRRQNNYGND